MDGGTRYGRPPRRRRRGLSPRGRGNLTGHIGNVDGGGSIPAWTGEPSKPAAEALGTAVYPRVDGGTDGETAVAGRLNGLSPRGRGNLLALSEADGCRRSIPAWTGEPRSYRSVNNMAEVYPRVDGGT